MNKKTNLLKRLGLAVCAGSLLAGGLYLSSEKKKSLEPLLVDEALSTEFGDFLNNHPFRERMKMDKNARKADGLPPNAYFEQEYLYTSNPELLRPTPEKLFELQEELARSSEMRAAPGDATNAWVERGPNNVGGRTRALMFAPGSNQIVFAGGVSGGLWKNNNITSAASQWQKVNGVPGNLNVTCITVDPNDSDTMYLGTGEVYTNTVIGNGIYKSTDGGDNWTSIYTGGGTIETRIAYVQDIIAWNNPTTNQTEIFFGAGTGLYSEEVTAGSGGAQWTLPGNTTEGMYRSTDGANFARLNDAIFDHTSGRKRSANNYAVGADGKLWMGTRSSVYGEGGGRVYNNDGSGWSFITDLGTAGRVEIVASQQDANKLYVLAQDNTDGGNPVKIFRTIDGFTSFTSLPQPNDADNGIPATDFTRGQSFYDLLIGMDPIDDDIVYVGGIDLFKTTNAFVANGTNVNWQQISKWSNNPGLNTLNVPLIHADQHGIAFAEETGTSTGRIIFGNDGGVAYTSNGGPDNVHRNNGYNVTQFYKAGINQNPATDKLIAGAQDNGVQFIDAAPGAPAPSAEIAGGDGCWVFIDQQSEYMIGSYVFNSYSYHLMDGTNIGNFPSPDTNAGDFVNQCGLDSDANILFANGTSGGNYQIFRYTIDPSGPGVTTATLDDALINHVPTYFTASPHTTNRVLVGTALGRIIRMDNANATPTWINLGEPGGVTGAVSDIRYGATENDIMVTFHNYGVNSIWYTADGGTTWVSKEGNLPDLPVKAILQNPSNPDEVIIGTELGVWKTNDWSSANPTWTQSQNGMSDVKVTGFDFRTADNTILAATYGRGMFTGTFDGDIPTVCDSNGTTATDVGITNVSFGNINNSDGPLKDNGYEDFTAISTTAVVGATCDLSISVNTDGNNTVESRVWIDWNNDLDFDDAGEEFDLGNATNTANGLTSASVFSITIPTSATTGNKRMRVSAKNGSAPTACEVDFDGEVEDYTIIVTDYCTLVGNNPTEEYIGNVTLGTIDNSSGESGYTDFTTPTVAATDLQIGEIPQISVSKVWTGTIYNEAVTVWVDYNQDGDFEDVGETVVLDGASTTTPVVSDFLAAVPNEAKLGNTRMRVSLQYSDTAGTTFDISCGNYDFGETEDYTVNIIAPVACAQTITYNGTWSGGVSPTSNEKALFTANYNTTTASIDACEIEIQAGATVTVSSSTYLKAEGNIIVNGTLIVQHEGSVVQVDDLATVTKGPSGIIEVYKTSLDMRPRDFMFVGSPMTAETRDGVYGTVVDAEESSEDEAFRVIYLNPENFEADPVVQNYAPYMGAETFLSIDNTFLGNHTASEAIVPGEGYIVYPQDSYIAGGITTTYDFKYTKGTLNNGEVTFPIQYNGATEDNFNLLSNPYASAIDMVELMNANPMINEVYFWEHATLPDNSLPGYLGTNPSMMDFSMRNLTTGMAAPNKPTSTPTQYIASGQGFAIKADESQNTIGQVTFNNAMRVTGNNGQYRSSENKELLWLSIENSAYELSSKTALGFLTQATEGIDRGYDSKRMATPLSIYTSVKTDEQLGIQARGTFDSDMIIPVGVATAFEETLSYTISLDSFEGDRLSETPIYLIDFVTETYVNLKEEDYTFTSNTINNGTRFVLAFEAPETLGVNEQASFDDSLQLFPNPAQDVVMIAFKGQEQLQSAQVIDVNGKRVQQIDLSDFNAQTSIDISNLATGVYFVEITGATSTTVKKLIVK